MEGQATFEHVESKFALTRSIRHGSVDALTLWLKLAKRIFGNVEQGWKTNMGPS